MDSLHLNPSATDTDRAVADMICLCFFFLLRPGEHCCTSHPDSSPFECSNVTFHRGNVQILATAPPHKIMTATSVTLTFTIQKNVVRGESVGQSTSGNKHFCPVCAAGRRFLHLRQHQGNHTHSATSTTPLCTFHAHPRQSTKVHTNAMRQALRTAASQLDPLADTSKIFTRALCTFGAMALVLARVDSSLIRLLGHWQSDSMLNHLRVEHLGVLHRHAQTMAQLSNFDTSCHHWCALLDSCCTLHRFIVMKADSCVPFSPITAQQTLFNPVFHQQRRNRWGRRTNNHKQISFQHGTPLVMTVWAWLASRCTLQSPMTQHVKLTCISS